MSAGEQQQEVFERVIQAAIEPSYMSEIARKLNATGTNRQWTPSLVAQVASVVIDNGPLEAFEVDYQGNDGQVVGSPHFGPTADGGMEETKEWKPYTILHNPDITESTIDDDILAVVDPNVTVEQKASVVDVLSGDGNEMSKVAERIMQDEMERQFRAYNVVRTPAYNDPGLDFIAEDNGKRDFSLAVEISVRSENPIDKPYVDAKKDKAFDKDSDVVILAPAFTQDMRDKYEVIDDKRWHDFPESEMIHLHHLPTDRPEVYRPFAKALPPESDLKEEGFPVIVPDSDRTRQKLSRTGHVGDDYPIVDVSQEDFINSLESVERNFRTITESGFRTQMREAIEPLLWEFSRPYQIEQWLIETYWDRGLTQDEVGQLVGVSDRTISEWLSDNKWDIVTRGVNTPITDDTVEIWRRMYNGDSPFPREMTGYEIQALYNKHPFFDLDDWREWYNLSDGERADIMSTRRSPQDRISYTILLGSEERLFPSYDFIINTLRRNGVDIRDGFFNETGTVYPTATALEYMLNRDVSTLGRGNEVDDRDIVEFRSDLEVETGEWFSDNEVPYAYEPFVVPSPFSVGGDDIDDLTRFVTQGRRDDALREWERIYNKHQLDDEGDVGIEEGFEMFNRDFIVPDFALYPDAGRGSKPPDWDGWTQWEYLIELAGPYGVGIINDWQSWYRVSGVAYKELAFKMLDLWQDTYFIITEDRGISDRVRNDEHYIVISPSQLDAGLDVLNDVLLL